MNEPLILEERESPEVVCFVLNRPERRNALTLPMLEELLAYFKQTEMDGSTRVVMLRGAGPAFCAGLDLKEAMQSGVERETATAVMRTLLAIATSPLVTVAAVHGPAVAGGAGIVSACDFAVAAEEAVFGYPEARRGLVAALVSVLLRRQLRAREARELLLTGELVSGRRAAEIGLVNRAVPADQVLAEAQRFVQLALRCAPGALAETKRLWESAGEDSLEVAMVRALDFHLAARGSDEAREGIAAFVERRTPQWDRGGE
jgi:methylglutaconyl-CoA hydratase